MMLDVRRLVLLRELATRGTIAAAASALHLTGPAISQQLAVLEREAGVPLLRKKGRVLELTAAGHALVAHTDVILADLARAETDLAALRSGALGSVRIAAFPSAARVLVSRLFDREYAPPGLSFQLHQHEPDQALAALAARDVDLAIAHEYSLLPRDLSATETSVLLQDPVLLAISAAEFDRRGLDVGAPVALADFSTTAWVAPGPEASCHEMTQRACGAAGFVLAPFAHATDFSVLTALVAADAGAALIPRMALPEYWPGLVLLELQDPITRTVTVVTRPGERGRPELARTIDALEAIAERWNITGDAQRLSA